MKGEGVEKEILYGANKTDDGEIVEPFNPKDVDIITQSMVVANIIERLKEDRIVLDPEFQRRPDLWDDMKQSRLIESLIVRIPLPSFYFDYDDEDDNYIVVDGLQRLWAIKRFAAIDISDPNRLQLTGMEYLTEYNGKMYEDLPLSLQRRIKEQTIVAYVIRPGTPESVRNSIFTRINTGGLQLTPAEIRNSVYRGKVASLLRELAHSNEFIEATNGRINSYRMIDCELVNRFLAFYLQDLSNYNGNLDAFLNDVLKLLKNSDDTVFDDCRQAFYRSMKTAKVLFGEIAFRKLKTNGSYGSVNKPLFECVSVSLAKLSSDKCDELLSKRNIFIDKYLHLLKDKDFNMVITNGTARISSIETRYKKINELISSILC